MAVQKKNVFSDIETNNLNKVHREKEQLSAIYLIFVMLLRATEHKVATVSFKKELYGPDCMNLWFRVCLYILYIETHTPTRPHIHFCLHNKIIILVSIVCVCAGLGSKMYAFFMFCLWSNNHFLTDSRPGV